MKSRTLTTGLAMFSMFFGAGNVVFPLAVGQYAEDGNLYASIGLLITAVGVPFLGLWSMTLFSGDYVKFFDRLGKTVGFLVSLAIMVLIGPLGAMPRTVTLSYATTKMFWPGVELHLFSILSCVLIFVLTVRRNRIVDIIGSYLTPLLLSSLAAIIIYGLISSPPKPPTNYDGWTLFLHGLNEGYLTMDLLGAFFFSTVIIANLRKHVTQGTPGLIQHTMMASSIGAGLLAAVYLGLSYLAAAWSEQLSASTPDSYLGVLAVSILGPHAGIVACVAVALACLTTAIALGAVFAEYLHKVIFKNKVSYAICLIATLIVNYFVSTLEFTGIMKFLAPILEVCYPALILLAVLNIMYKLWGFRFVKFPTIAVFLFSLWGSLY